MGTRETQARAGPVSSAGGTTRATSVAAPGLRHPRALCTIWADAVPPPGSSSLFGLARPLYLPLHSCKCCLWHSFSGACSQPWPQLLPRVLELGAGRALAHQPSGRVCAPRRLRQVTVPELSYHPAGDQASSSLLLCSGCAAFGVYRIPLVYLAKQTQKYLYSLCWVGILILFSTSLAYMEGPQPGLAGWNASVVCPWHQCKVHLHERTRCNCPASFNFRLKDGFGTSHFGVSLCLRIARFRHVSLSNRWMVYEIEHKAV